MKESNILLNGFQGIRKYMRRLFTNPYKKIGLSWFMMRVIKNSPPEKHQTIKFMGKKISFYSRAEFLYAIKEIFISQIYCQEPVPDAYIIDCGANIGLSVIYLKTLFPDSHIIAFEPDDMNFDLLKKNIAAFGFQNIDLRKEIVWIDNTYLKFASHGTMASKIDEDTTDNNVPAIKAIRLKDFIYKPVDFLKIDIEGAEYEVLRSIEENLYFVKNIFIEYHGTFDQNEELIFILNILLASGFKYYIKEATNKNPTPFVREPSPDYDVQLNIFGFRI